MAAVADKDEVEEAGHPRVVAEVAEEEVGEIPTGNGGVGIQNDRTMNERMDQPSRSVDRLP